MGTIAITKQTVVDQYDTFSSDGCSLTDLHYIGSTLYGTCFNIQEGHGLLCSYLEDSLWVIEVEIPIIH